MKPWHRHIGFARFGNGDYKGVFCEKLLEAFPVSSRANAIQLQDRPGLVRASLPGTVVATWDNRFKGKKLLCNRSQERGVKKCETTLYRH